MEKILMIFVLLLCIYILGTLPRFTRKKETKTFCHCLFAHRGLFTPDQRIPENSMRAFQEAVRHGYGIELDIQRTKDNQIVVFHDHTLSRMCGIDLPVCELTYKELQKLTLMNSTEKIPLFQDVLDCCKIIPANIVLSPLILLLCAGTRKTARKLSEDSSLPI